MSKRFYYWVECFFDMDMLNYAEKTALLEQRVGKTCSGSGAECGSRNLCWLFNKRVDALKAFEVLSNTRWVYGPLIEKRSTD